MKPYIILPLLAVGATLAGCDASPPHQSETLVVPDETPSLPGIQYNCEDGKIVHALYIEGDSPQENRALLEIGDKKYTLFNVVSASGAKYATEHGLSPDKSLIWWTKGNEATISEMPLDHTARPDRDEKQITICRESASEGAGK